MARSIVPPSGHPDDPHDHGRAADRGETVHPAYDASLDPETLALRAQPPSERSADSGRTVGPRPGPYMHSLIPAPRRRPGRTLWAALGGGAAAAVVLAVIGAALSTTAPSPDGSVAAGAAPVSDQDGAGDPWPPASGPYVLEALSESGDDVAVTYSNGRGGIATSEVRSGWSAEIPDGSGTPPVFTASTGTAGVGSQQEDAITCRVRQGGEILEETTATGDVATADCSGF